MRSSRRTLRWFAAALAVVLIAPAFAAGAENPHVGEPVELAFWTTEVERDRMALQRELAEEFALHNPKIQVKIVPVREQDMDRKLMAAAAARTLPDVVRIGLEYVKGYVDSGVLSSAAATELIDSLDAETFFSGALDMVKNASGGYDAVPIDGWAQGIWYRTDWFENHDLAPPATWDAMLAAARAFYDPPNGRYGIVLGTASRETYTQQTFEHVALSNGARLFTEKGVLIEPNERLREAIVFYKKLAACAPPGSNSVAEARQLYLTGAVAMVFYSPYIVDDIAGMAPGEIPVEGLAGKTGFVSMIEGPHGDKASYGQVVSLGIVRGDHTAAAKKWVRFLLEQGYLRWCFMTPGGKTPVRKGILDEWSRHDVFAPYEPGFAEKLALGMEGIRRWGYFPQRTVPVVSDVYGKHVVPRALGEHLTGNLDADEALARIISEVRRLEAMRK